MDTVFKIPLNKSISDFTNQRSNDFQQQMTKGIPCHVTKIEKDMVTVAFDAKNNTWTVPSVKMPQAFSPYGRDPTKVGDKGYAAPADYNLGGNSGLGGGIADFSPRGNLTPLVFHPISHTNTEKRDYDQYTLTGGTNGVRIIQKQQQTQTQSPPQAQRRVRALEARVLRYHTRRFGWKFPQPNPLADEDNKNAFMQIDKDGKIQHTSTDGKHEVTVDQNQKKITLNVPVEDKVYLGGDGQEGIYLPVMLVDMTPSKNVFARKS